MLCLYLAWFGLLGFFATTSLISYMYFRHHSSKAWNLKIDKSFAPSVAIMIPAYNEEKWIIEKLQNVKETIYPKDKMEIIVIDDSSTDQTVLKAEQFIQQNQELNVRIQEVKPRCGKARALNQVLESVKRDIVIVSDADSFWSNDMLAKTLPYLADQAVGAVSGMQVLTNPSASSTTEAENCYLQLTSYLRVGQSKLYSTIRFEGGACFFRRNAFEKFDEKTGADDSGTALEIVQHGYRTIVVPEAKFYSPSPRRFSQRVRVKVRRANHLLSLWKNCVILLLKNRLVLPKRIAIPEIILFMVDPFVFFTVTLLTLPIILLNPLSYFSLSIAFLLLGVTLFQRRMFGEVILGNFILVYALCSLFLGKKYVSWEK